MQVLQYASIEGEDDHKENANVYMYLETTGGVNAGLKICEYSKPTTCLGQKHVHNFFNQGLLQLL